MMIPSYAPYQEDNIISSYAPSQEDNMVSSYAPSQEVSYGFKKMSIDSIVDLTNDDDDNTPDINTPTATLKEVGT